SMFGRERSHGCVNMTPYDAKNIFQWAGPNLPQGWHGVRATNENPGTRVVVHEDPKPASATPAASSSSPTPPSSVAAADSKPKKSEKSDKSDKNGKSEKAEKKVD